jgi:hypothetical protein
LQHELCILCPLPLLVQLFQPLSYPYGRIPAYIAVSIQCPLELVEVVDSTLKLFLLGLCVLVVVVLRASNASRKLIFPFFQILAQRLKPGKRMFECPYERLRVECLCGLCVCW